MNLLQKMECQFIALLGLVPLVGIGTITDALPTV